MAMRVPVKAPAWALITIQNPRSVCTMVSVLPKVCLSLWLDYLGIKLLSPQPAHLPKRLCGETQAISKGVSVQVEGSGHMVLLDTAPTPGTCWLIAPTARGPRENGSTRPASHGKGTWQVKHLRLLGVGDFSDLGIGGLEEPVERDPRSSA